MRGTAKAASARSESTESTKLRLPFGISAALLAVLALVLPAGASALSLGEQEEFSGATVPLTIAEGPDGNFWFGDAAEFKGGENKLGRITPSGVITEYGGLSGVPVGIAAGPDGKVWFTAGPKVARCNPAECGTSIETFGEANGLPAGGSPWFIAKGPDGNMWFTDQVTHQIGRITMAGAITEYGEANGLSAGATPCSITAGSDGNVWFGDCGATKAVGRITPAGAITEYPTQSGPESIALGSDGKVWFIQSTPEERFGSVTPSGELTYYPTPAQVTSWSSISSGPEGNLWVENQYERNEQQEVKLEAASGLGGTYKLGFEGQETGATGSGNLLSAGTGKGDVKRFTTSCKRTKGSTQLKSCTTTTGAEVGMRISGTGLEPETTITKIEGTTISISIAAASGLESGSATTVTAGWITGVSTTTGALEVGQTITGTGIPANTKILAVGVGTITPSNAPSAAGTGISLSATAGKAITNVTVSTGTPVKGEAVSATGVPAGATIAEVVGIGSTKGLVLSAEPTEAKTAVSWSADLPAAASATTVKEALEKLSTIGAGNLSLSGSGTESPVTRTATFEGKLARTDVAQLTCNATGLTGTSPSCSVKTNQDGRADRFVRIKPASGEITEFALLPATTFAEAPLAANTIAAGGGNLWYTTTTTGKVGKFGLEPNPLHLLTAKKSGTGQGWVHSEAPAYTINCGTSCTTRSGSLDAATLIASGAQFVSWTSCPGTVSGRECLVSLSADKEATAEFSATHTLTVTKTGTGTGWVHSESPAYTINCGTLCTTKTGFFATGATVVLTASGAEFTEWTSCPGIASGRECTVSLSADKSAQAKYGS